jgi:hypothetical protein
MAMSMPMPMPICMPIFPGPGVGEVAVIWNIGFIEKMQRDKCEWLSASQPVRNSTGLVMHEHHLRFFVLQAFGLPLLAAQHFALAPRVESQMLHSVGDQ